jgi:GNAT superfamily N-acetyltransferase
MDTVVRVIRPARPDDVPTILALIRELAAYEREPDAVVATEAGLEAALFDDRAALFGLIAEHASDDGPIVAGFALWFLNFSTWVGRHGIYLEDLYVRPELRGHGYGRELLIELARIADERGYGRLEWAVLDWNESAHRFYESLGAVPMQEWTIWRVSGDSLPALARRADVDGRAGS